MATACVDEGVLFADLDNDGANEAFALAAFADGVFTANEVRGEHRDWPRRCEPRFAWYQPDRKDGDAVLIDLLGIVDADGDGRSELVIGTRAGPSRTVAVYRATGDGAHLDRVAVSEDDAWHFR